jgi:organic radical activating enzyme
MLVREIFSTIQGEGPNVGLPAVFIRLGGCPLKCVWCDTDFREEASEVLPVSEVMQRVLRARAPGCRLAVITGGEPMEQDLRPLVRPLREAGLRCQVETSGIVHQYLPDDVEVVVSPKTHRINYFGRVDAWKYVIRAGELCCEDGLPYARTQGKQGDSNQLLARPFNDAPIYVQPCDEHDEEKNHANREAALWSCLNFGYRFSYQVHKAINMP